MTVRTLGGRQARRPFVDLTGVSSNAADTAPVFTDLPAQGVDGALCRHRAKEQAVIVLWDGRRVATEGTPHESAYAFFMQMRDGEVESSSCSDQWDRAEPGDR